MSSSSNSAPEVNNPQDGLLTQLGKSANNAYNYAKETVMGNSAEASKEANKEQAKGNVPGKDSISDRVSAGLGAASDKINQHEHETKAEANKHSV